MGALGLPSAKGFGRAIVLTVLVLAAIKVAGRFVPQLKSLPLVGEVF